MTCIACKHACADGYEMPYAVCRRFPPRALDATSSTFPLVNLQTFKCGEFAALPKSASPTPNRKSVIKRKK